MSTKVNARLLPPVLLFTVLLFITITNSYAIYTPYGIEINPRYPMRFAQPIPVYINGYLNEEAQTTLDITLPEGIQLLRGQLHLAGVYNTDTINGGYTVSEEWISVQINRPGTYELSVKLDGKISHSSPFAQALPLTITRYFYAREDTVVFFYDRKDLEHAIRDSLIVPQAVLEQRRMNRMREEVRAERLNEWAKRVAENQPPLVLSRDLVEICRAYHLLENHYTKWYHLSDYYNPDQAKLIFMSELMTAPPELEKVDSVLALDCHGSLTPEQFQAMSRLLKRQATDLYNIDQQIIQSQPVTQQRVQLLRSRVVMLFEQTEERKAEISPELKKARQIAKQIADQKNEKAREEMSYRYWCSDSINLSNLDKFYTTSQIEIIKREYLMIAPPDLAAVVQSIKKNLILSKLTDEKIRGLSQLFLKEANVLYQFDQSIIYSKDTNETSRLIKQRPNLYHLQFEERNAYIDSIRFKVR